MSDLISRQAAIDALKDAENHAFNLYYQGLIKAHKIIADLPSAQPEKVKCKKCRYVYYDKEFGNYWCNRMSDSFMVEEDGYCKWGK